MDGEAISTRDSSVWENPRSRRARSKPALCDKLCAPFVSSTLIRIRLGSSCSSQPGRFLFGSVLMDFDVGDREGVGGFDSGPSICDANSACEKVGDCRSGECFKEDPDISHTERSSGKL